MLGSRKRDYKTSYRSVYNNLKKHSIRMKELILKGLTKEQASKQAYDELFMRKVEMKDQIDKLVEGKIKGSDREIEAKTRCPRCKSNLVCEDEMHEGLEVECGHCHLELVAVPRMIFVRKGEE